MPEVGAWQAAAEGSVTCGRCQSLRAECDVECDIEPLCGSAAVFAGEVLDDHLIMDLQREHFVPVLKPKIDGTLLRPKFVSRARGATCMAMNGRRLIVSYEPYGIAWYTQPMDRKD